ncbi:hypothetical protein WDL1CHR_00652 [Variovorax sp. WDL1]|nr:DUF6236 family protein [Variovorax sp. WDL1]PNG56552.1 hypothetical protein CHC07_02971 [Variovorax sp. B4]PNG57976.1 hypothetical protein CHC06_02974 [Variovorax sp. B2]VTV09551.1 hypothetical protein WDL1CHR_00652 [Variovorax sp. WDL1]
MVGEARRRAQYDPTFGKIPKTESEKRNGLIVTPPLSFIDNRLNGSPLLTAEGLRFAALFFDDLLLPVHKRFGFDANLTADAEYLIQTGVLQRQVPQTDFGSNQGDVDLGMMYYSTLYMLNQQQPNKWSIATGPDFFNWDYTIVSQQNDRDVSVELMRAVPIPEVATPLAELLEFREKRRPELLDLRWQVGALAAEVLKAEDMQSALNARAEQVHDACENLLKASRDFKYKMKFSDLKLSLELKDPLSPLISTAALGNGIYSGEPISLALGALSAVASLIKLTSEPKIISNHGKKGPYAYAYHAYNDLLN